MAFLKMWEDKGLTLLELLMAVAILGLLFAIAFPVGWTFYLDYQMDSERNILVALLENGRNLAMINAGESDHGLYFDDGKFVIFRGASYALRRVDADKIFPRNNNISVSGPSEIIFESLSGSTASSTYALNNGRKTLNVYVNSEGRVEF